MTTTEHPDHEQIEELLAGYTLHILEGEDAVEADRLLSEHVPGCVTCRHLLADFQALTGDLALATDPIAPPELVWPRIRRSMDAKRSGGRRRLATMAVSASMVLVFGVAGWNVLLNGRVSDEQGARSRLTSMVKQLTGDDGRRMITLRDDASRQPAMFVSYLPGQPMTRIGGVNVPQPAPGSVYRVWLFSLDGTIAATDFTPDADGYVMLEFDVDIANYQEIRVTEEPATMGGQGVGAFPATPVPHGAVRWSALIYPE